MAILYERNSSNKDPKISKNAILIFTRNWWMGTLSFNGSIILWRKDGLRVRETDLSCTFRTYLTHMIAKRGEVT